MYELPIIICINFRNTFIIVLNLRIAKSFIIIQKIFLIIGFVPKHLNALLTKPSNSITKPRNITRKPVAKGTNIQSKIIISRKQTTIRLPTRVIATHTIRIEDNSIVQVRSTVKVTVAFNRKTMVACKSVNTNILSTCCCRTKLRKLRGACRNRGSNS